MGQIFSTLYSALFPNKEYKLVMVGALPSVHLPTAQHSALNLLSSRDTLLLSCAL